MAPVNAVTLLALGLLVSPLAAQSVDRQASETRRSSGATSERSVTPPASPVFAPAPAESVAPRPAQKRARPVSAGVAAALAAASPKYEPPPPRPATPPSEQIDLREIDRPKNTIIRLPKVVVQEPRAAVFRERDIHTEKGLTDIAMRRYISDADRALNRFTIPLFGTSTEARALAMYAEEERLQNMASLKDAADNASLSNADTGTYIKRESEKTFLRTSDFGWGGGQNR